MAKDKIYYETCYVYEVLLIRVATSTLNPGKNGLVLGNGNKSEDLQVSMVP